MTKFSIQKGASFTISPVKLHFSPAARILTEAMPVIIQNRVQRKSLLQLAS